MSATDPKVRKFTTCAENAAERGLRWCRERDEAVAERDELRRELQAADVEQVHTLIDAVEREWQKDAGPVAVGARRAIEQVREQIALRFGHEPKAVWNTCPLHGHYVARRPGAPLIDCPTCATTCQNCGHDKRFHRSDGCGFAGDCTCGAFTVPCPDPNCNEGIAGPDDQRCARCDGEGYVRASDDSQGECGDCYGTRRVDELRGLLQAAREERDRYRSALQHLADRDSWLGDPESHVAALHGHFTPFELAREALKEPA